ncbi:hypothetical protein GCM10010985_40910 [Caballeronia grimmiae]|uniref:Lipoprotein n=2 Tax=Burkholderiaceae TaxID=119060 RepID=A0ABQ1RW67_9BURK|nr:hypothetical protein GCM10010985_40910 [Caballeronia grimmiae]
MRMNSITRIAVLGAVVAAMSLTAGCKRGSDSAGAGGAASDTSAASAPMASAPAATSFPATAASDAPAGASQ